MVCNLSEELIYEYLEGELDDLTALIVKEHLNECSECRKKAADIKQLFYELSELEKEDIFFPKELEIIGEKAYEICENTGKSMLIKYLDIQKGLLKGQKSVLLYTPGSKIIKDTVKFLGKGTVKTSSILLKQGFKLAYSRG